MKSRHVFRAHISALPEFEGWQEQTLADGISMSDEPR